MKLFDAALALGKRVVLSRPIARYPTGRTGLLMSLQSGMEPDGGGVYATVAFDLSDWSDEENVPLSALRELSVRG